MFMVLVEYCTCLIKVLSLLKCIVNMVFVVEVYCKYGVCC